MFIELLKKQILKEASNYYTDNYDFENHGGKRPLKKRIINYLKWIVFSKPVLGITFQNNYIFKDVFLGKIFKLDKYFTDLEFFYTHLEDEDSKQLLLTLMAHYVLGYVKVKLPLSKPEYWQGIKDMEKTRNPNDTLKLNSYPWQLEMIDLNKVNIPVRMYYSPKSAYTTFCLEQYRKVAMNCTIEVTSGDTVLDLGGCYGDTALYFSNKTGKAGKVYTFEFIPGNISVLNKNVELNPQLGNNIEIVANPVWDKSGITTYYKDKGASSKISFEEFSGYDGTVDTLTIDDFVKKYNVAKVDFIKADIEGAEPYALRGAINTIKNHRPKLAICIYHNLDDFTKIIRYLDDLNLGYKFYLGQYTIYFSEVVLYAMPPKK